MHRKITRQSWWNLRRASERQYRTKPLKLGEGVETGWRASHVDEGTVRLSSKGESDRITQRSAVQIRPTQPWTPLPKCSGVRLFTEPSVSSDLQKRLRSRRFVFSDKQYSSALPD